MRPALFLSGSEITENFIIIHIKKDFLCGRENTGLWHTLELSNECQITVVLCQDLVQVKMRFSPS
jgi:hypothetical protein